MFSKNRKFQSFALAIVSMLAMLLVPATAANAVPASTYHYQFEGNTNPFVGNATLSLLGSCPSNVSGFTPCNTSTSFGTASGDGYLAWTSSSARGGGFKITTPTNIGASYSMSLKFEFSNVSGYRKIVDYENYLSDNGFYLLSGGINFYPLGTSNTTYAANTPLNLLVTREAAPDATYPNRGTFTVYVYSGSTLTQVLQVDDTYGSSLAANSGSGSLFGFFFDDGATSAEATPSGKVYDLKLWSNTALTAAQVGAVATASPTVTTPATPSTPTATSGSVSATVSITAAAPGSAAPDSYLVTASPGGNTCTITTPDTSCVVTGLTAGTAYTFTATATNGAGTSSASSTSNSVTPTVAVPVAPGTPGAPTAVAGNGQATVTVVAPSTGGTPTSYTVTASPGGATCTVTSPATSCVVSPLTNGTAYRFTSTATNAGGTSASSAQSAAVTPVNSLAAPGTPGTPTAVAGNGQATVTVVAPSSGGAVATYLVTASPGGATCTVTSPATSCVISPLTNGTAYTFSATATNATGTSSASSASAASTPVAPAFVNNAPLISSMSSRSFSTVGGGTLTITGSNMGGVVSVTVSGVAATVLSNTSEELVIRIPTGGEGYATIVIKTGIAMLTFSDAFKYVKADSNASNAGQNAPANLAKKLFGFNPGSSLLTAAMKTDLRALANAHSKATRWLCSGFSQGPTILPGDPKLALQRATEACAYLKSLLPNITVVTTIGQNFTNLGSLYRRVEIIWG